ncbi:hypothetical protein SUDANB95_02772 [Actinosynnema sp. ALI-1.44]
MEPRNGEAAGAVETSWSRTLDVTGDTLFVFTRRCCVTCIGEAAPEGRDTGRSRGSTHCARRRHLGPLRKPRHGVDPVPSAPSVPLRARPGQCSAVSPSTSCRLPAAPETEEEAVAGSGSVGRRGGGTGTTVGRWPPSPGPDGGRAAAARYRATSPRAAAEDSAAATQGQTRRSREAISTLVTATATNAPMRTLSTTGEATSSRPPGLSGRSPWPGVRVLMVASTWSPRQRADQASRHTMTALRPDRRSTAPA